MTKHGLTPALQAEYTHLKNHVDRCMEAWIKRETPSAGNKYWYAKDELRKFVSDRRKEGFNI